jgi:hypothetical protein
MTGLSNPSAETQQNFGGGTPAPLSNFRARLDTLSR